VTVYLTTEEANRYCCKNSVRLSCIIFLRFLKISANVFVVLISVKD